MFKFILISLLFLPAFVSAQVISTVVGNGGPGYSGDGGAATSAAIGATGMIEFDNSGNYYISGLNFTIRKISTSGTISTIAGNGTAGFSGDGGIATSAQFNFTGGGGMAFDELNNLYVADQENNRIRKIDGSTGIISTFAGNGTAGYSGDGGGASSAQFNSPIDLAFDSVGNLFVLDGFNYRIRKIDVAGIVHTIAGTGTMGFSGDGGLATAAEIYSGGCITIGNNNELYQADGIRIRKIDLTTGIITTIAGNGVPGHSGDAGPATGAQFFNTMGIAVDKLDNIFVSDRNSHRIRIIDAGGIINTVTGNGVSGFSGDGGASVAAQIYSPRGLAVDLCGSLYIVDNGNFRIRKVTMPPILTIPVIVLSAGESSSSVPLGSSVTVNATVANAGSSYIIHWLNRGVEFSTTTVPVVTYTKAPGIDTITARVVSTATYGCYDSTTSAPHIVTVGSTGIVRNYMAGGFSVYPNPGHNTLTISGAEVINSVTVTNLVGEVLIKEHPEKEALQISIAHLPPGMYLLRVNDVYVQRFMKE